MPQANFIHDFGRDGYYLAPGVLAKDACTRLTDAIRGTRAFGPDLFLSEEAFNAGPKSHYNTNPIPGRNILERLDKEVSFVEKSPEVNTLLSTLLGNDFRWFYQKLICRVPRNVMPEWVLRGIKNGPTTTLGAYIKPEYRDIAYYHDNELHQDIMDYARMPQEIKEHRIITMYVYLSDVSAEDAPTCVLPTSHLLGANPFPFNVKRSASNPSLWIYTDALGNIIETTVKPISAPTGSILFWHSCLLHGARPIPEGRWRFGLRYMVACAKDCKKSALDDINKTIRGPLFLEKDYTSHQKVGPDGFLASEQSDFSRSYFSDV